MLGYCGNRAKEALLGDSRLLRVVVLTSQDDSTRTSQVWDRLPRSATWQDHHYFTCCRDLGLLTCVMKTKRLVRELQGLQGENSALGMTLPPVLGLNLINASLLKGLRQKLVVAFVAL